jgi:sterol 3beta-glucosyltransferase
MKILLVTAGSRGDVEPFVALGERARAHGHEVRLVTPDNSGADTGDLDVASMGVDYSAMIQSQGVSVAAAMRAYRSVVRPLMRAVIVESARAAYAYRPDVIVWHPKILSAPIVADALGVPHARVEIVPAITPTRAFPAAGTVARDLGPLNRLTYRAADAAQSMFRRDLAEARSVVGAPERAASAPAATLMPISPAILERPDDWPASVHLTGRWTRDVGADGSGAGAGLAPEVAAFLVGGPYLYAGFGSMAAKGAEDRGRAIVQAARDRGIRAVIATGLGGIEVPEALHGDDVLVVDSVRHEQVLPGAVAAIHHGGIGTIQAATAAGTVSVIVPFIADQPFWGARLHDAGLAPAPVRRRSLSARTVGAALDAVDGCRPRVTAAAQAMAGEDGTGAALEVLEVLEGLR